MSTIDTIFEAEREAKRIVETATAEATEVIRAAEEAKAREIQAETQRLADAEETVLQEFEAELDKEVAAMEQQSATAIQQLQQSTKAQHTAAVQAVVTALKG